MAFNINFNLKWLIIPVAIIIGLSVFNIRQYNNNERLETYNRQLSGDLSAQEKLLQQANNELGILKSELVTQEELAKRLKNDKEEIDKEFEKFKKKHDLVIKSKDKTIARLKQLIENGTTEFIVSENCEGIEDRCVVSYSWSDNYLRFKLRDPNIFEKDNEIFESDQIFKIYGEIYQEKQGFLQIRRLVLREVYQKEDGMYEPIPNAKADIVDSKFDYSNEPSVEKSNWTDLFRLRGIILIGSEIIQWDKDLQLGLGLGFFEWKNVGIQSHTAFDFSSTKNIAQYIGLSYSPKFFDVDFNFAISASVGTYFYSPFQNYSIKIDLLFYLNN